MGGSLDTSFAGLTFASFPQRLLIAFLDYLIFLPVTFFIFPFFLYASLKYHAVLPLLFFNFLFIGFLAWCIVFWGGTPACLLLRFRILNFSRQKLSLKAAIVRLLPLLISSLLYLNLLHIFLLHQPQNSLFIDQSGIVELMVLHSGGLFFLYRLSTFFYIPDLLFILFNHHSRSLTDYLSKSIIVLRD